MAATGHGNPFDEDDRWRDAALARYGPSVADATLPLYCGSHREMVEDDNVRGAVPALTLAAPCPWRMNRPALFYLCLLAELRYHRADDELRLYLDVRGERDLRHPGDSSIERRPSGGAGGACLLPCDGGHGPTLLTGEFVAEVSMPGRYRGYLSFHAAQFQRPGTYYFTFADIRRNPGYRQMLANMEARGVPRTALAMVRDYPEVPLLEVHEEGGLLQAFEDGDGKIEYALPGSPFEGETEEEERARFAPFVGDDVLVRHEAEGSRSRKWWVTPDDAVQAVPQRMAIVGPGGRTVVTTLGNPE